MGWLWGSNKSTDSDPFRDLDPSLKDFLIKESPVKYKPTSTPPPPTPPSPSTQSPQQAPQFQSTSTDSPPAAPPQSLYPDGRYAHLWKNYRPLDAVENEAKSDQEKLMDVLEGYKERRAQIGKTALENCCEEQMAVQDCYENGSLGEKLVLCRGPKKRFERCYDMQSRFLKALGYLSSFDRPAAVDEQIQMHADTLYHRMLAQEAAIKEAEAAGRPVPTFPSIHSADQSPLPPSTNPSASTDAEELPVLSPDTMKALKPEAAMDLRRRIKDLDPFAREAEERATMAELHAAEDAAREVKRYTGKLDREREKRREEGKETAKDSISGWFGW